MKITTVAINEVIPYARNPRKNEDAIAKVSASLQEYGWQQPIVVDADMIVIAGHTRLEAAKRLGMDEVPIHVADKLSDTQVKAFRIADNRVGQEAEWDLDLLKQELGDLSELSFDLSLTGFDSDQLDELLFDAIENEGLTDEDLVPDVEENYVSRLGDVWVLGNHRLMCGDSTVISDVEKLCDGKLMDACWTDPPYNVDYESSAGKIKNDNMKDSEFKKFLKDAFITAFSVMREGAPIYVAHADTEGLNFRSAFKEAGFKLSGCLIWVKDSLVLGRSDYQWRHEPILYGWKEGAAHSWFGGRKNTTVLESDYKNFTVHSDGTLDIDIGSNILRVTGTDLCVEQVLPTTIRAEKPKRSDKHPTMKPVGLVLQMLENSSKVGSSVLDLFGGSGSTMIACQKSGRKSYLMEFDPKYADVIVKRWQDFTGKKAIHAESGISFDELISKK